MFTFTPLLGAKSNSPACQSILELDGGVKILVDVGWDESFDPAQLAELEKHVSTISFILLTHATTPHLGAFAHCCKHVPGFVQIPVYATSPVIAFGRTLLHDVYASAPLAATFIPLNAIPTDGPTSSLSSQSPRSDIFRPAPTAEEITKYFSSITPLKYSQPYQPTPSHFSAPVEGLTLTAYNSGHTLGGTIWHIQYGMESVVYAVDWNQARENVIAGAAWFGGVGGSEVIEQLRKPTALVCSSIGADRIAPPGGRKARDDALLAHIRSSLAKGGTVVIPSDSSARVLELSWILEKAWHDAANDPVVNSARVYLASKSAVATLRHARSLLEWMDDSIVRDFDAEDDTAAAPPNSNIKGHRRIGSRQTNGQVPSKPSRPFEFTHIKVLERKSQVERALNGNSPAVILASDLSLDWGYSRAAFEAIAQKAENLIILTERRSIGGATTADNVTIRNNATTGIERPSLCAQLWEWYDQRQDGVAVEKGPDGLQLEQIHTGGREITTTAAVRAPLNEVEAQTYQQHLARQRQLESSLGTMTDGTGVADETLADDESSSSSSEDSDDEHQGHALNTSAALSAGSRNKVAVSDEDLGVSILLRKRGVFDFDVRNKKGRNAMFPYAQVRKRGDEFGDYIKPEDFLRAEERADDGTLDRGPGAPGQNRDQGQKRKWDEMAKPQSQVRGQQSRLGDGMTSLGGGAHARPQGTQAPDEGEDSDSEYEPEEAGARANDGPSKLKISESKINVHARLAFVDFAGLHDRRSLQMLIPLIDPKRLILTRGSPSETESLVSDCLDLLASRAGSSTEDSERVVLAPTNNESVDASVDTNAWIVKLSRDLAKRLHWQNVRNMGVVTITGQLKGEKSDLEIGQGQGQDERDAKKQKLLKEDVKTPEQTAEAEQDDVKPVLDAVPATVTATTRSVFQPIHVGDLRLADLRRLMSASGHSAEFRGEGTLLIDGMIAVRKLGSGKIVVEGAPVSALAAVTASRQPSSFVEVKRKIYEGLAVVAAS